ncbi:MAG: UPF0175 family protein [Planctomycetota bacterium]
MLDRRVEMELDENAVDQLESLDLEQYEFDDVPPLALAVEMYWRGWLSIGLAAMIADMDRHEFVTELARRDRSLVRLSGEEVRAEISLVKSLINKKENS